MSKTFNRINTSAEKNNISPCILPSQDECLDVSFSSISGRSNISKQAPRILKLINVAFNRMTYGRDLYSSESNMFDWGQIMFKVN